jgi:DNA polymerase-3 subunit delta'
LIVTACEPDLLLPTIRSRLLPVRLRPLPVAEAAEFLIRTGDVPPEAARRAAQLAGGSIGRALGYLPQGDEPGPLDEIRQQGRDLMRAALEVSGARAAAAALAESPAGARAGFSDSLESLTLWLRDLGAASAGASDVVLNRDALPWLQELARKVPDPAGIPEAIRAVEETIRLTKFNINPQLATAVLLKRVRAALLGC